MTFEEWLFVWESSGKLHLRGKKASEYRMLRRDPSKPYTSDNAEIVTNSEMYSRMNREYAKAPEWRARISFSHQGKTLSAETKLKMSLQRRGQKLRWPRPVEIDGVKYESLTKAAKSLRISLPALSQRLKTGRYPYKLL